ncbi:MAG: NmrA/HSCARG family protein [Bryobacteraceae bacterium]|nr:NmrA/HSCARG family protein [Bryobacteraceae bacterium]
MDQTNRLIFVAGATGQQGGAVADALHRAGWRVRTITRDPGKPAAQALAAKGIEVQKGDLEDRPFLESALAGCSGVFAVTTPFGPGLESEVRQGYNLAEVAKKAGVSHFVFASVGAADRNTGIPHFETKWKVEQRIQELALPATILRPVFFMENFLNFSRPDFEKGVLALPAPADKPMPMVAVEDIGRFAAAAFAAPGDFIGKVFELAGDEPSPAGAAAIIERVAGKPLTYHALPASVVPDEDLRLMFEWFYEHGFNVDIAALNRIIPMRRFEEWAAAQKWI